MCVRRGEGEEGRGRGRGRGKGEGKGEGGFLYAYMCVSTSLCNYRETHGTGSAYHKELSSVCVCVRGRGERVGGREGGFLYAYMCVHSTSLYIERPTALDQLITKNFLKS